MYDLTGLETHVLLLMVADRGRRGELFRDRFRGYAYSDDQDAELLAAVAVELAARIDSGGTSADDL